MSPSSSACAAPVCKSFNTLRRKPRRQLGTQTAIWTNDGSTGPEQKKNIPDKKKGLISSGIHNFPNCIAKTMSVETKSSERQKKNTFRLEPIWTTLYNVFQQNGQKVRFRLWRNRKTSGTFVAANRRRRSYVGVGTFCAPWTEYLSRAAPRTKTNKPSGRNAWRLHEIMYGACCSRPNTEIGSRIHPTTKLTFTWPAPRRLPDPIVGNTICYFFFVFWCWC